MNLLYEINCYECNNPFAWKFDNNDLLYRTCKDCKMNELEKLVKNIARNGRANPNGVVAQIRLLQIKYPNLTDKQCQIWIRETDVVLANALRSLY